ncbi:MAG: hypothetical protein D6791_12915 [Chloroflexi bacterium]|nr:MAG: hypothetical protein D6791_12915 [Chloroflexota bacterium]
MTNQGTESQFEDTTIERLKALGYQYQPASPRNRDFKSVMLAGRLRAYLPAKALDEAVAAARNPDDVALAGAT